MQMRPAKTHNNSVRLRPLRELPALAIDRAEVDVRGWMVSGRDGRPLGRVSDLLADAESLQAEYVIVTIDGEGPSATSAKTVLPIAALRAVPEQRQLVSDRGGVTAIRLRYYSTTSLVWWAVGLLLLAATLLLVLGA